MTQTLRRAARQDQVRRKGRVYLFTTLRVHEAGDKIGLVLDGTTEDGYVGKTRQTLAQREQQHRGGSADGEPVPGEDLEEQPWWDLTVGGIRLLEQGFWTDDELAEREKYWIDRIRPRYNFIDNGHNERRIPKFTAREHRDSRDRARGVQPRQWPPFGMSKAATERPPAPKRKRPKLSAKAKRRRNRAIAWAVTFAALWVAGGFAPWPDVPWRTWPIGAAAVASLILIPKLRRKRRKAALVLLAVGAFLLWAVTG